MRLNAVNVAEEVADRYETRLSEGRIRALVFMVVNWMFRSKSDSSILFQEWAYREIGAINDEFGFVPAATMKDIEELREKVKYLEPFEEKAVDPFRGHGIGRAMVERLFAEIRAGYEPSDDRDAAVTKSLRTVANGVNKVLGEAGVSWYEIDKLYETLMQERADAGRMKY